LTASARARIVGASVTKQELIERVWRSVSSDEGDLTKKTVARVIEAAFGELREYFEGGSAGRFTYPGFGTFSRQVRKERLGMHPRTHEKITIPEQATVAFTVAQELKNGLNRKKK
jgi:DNA-binding protein HU-beta